MTLRHPLLERQLRRATRPDGGLDVERLMRDVADTYVEADRERERTDHAINVLVHELEYRAEHDPLTSLPNRVRLASALEAALHKREDGAPAALILLDLDKFKEVNDTLGHAAGDELLLQVAHRLMTLTEGRGVAARLGGDEFAIVLPRLQARPEAVDFAAQVVAALSNPYTLEQGGVVIGCSAGVALIPEHGEEARDLQRRADMALYAAKQTGFGGATRLFDFSMDAALTQRKSLKDALQEALEGNRFELHLQPIVDATHQRVRSYEALLRWRDPALGQVPPADFIPVAEETGLIVPIGEWVIRAACDIAAHIPDDIGMAINLSPIQLRSERLPEVFAEALADSGVAASRLEAEITESVLIDDDPRSLQNLQKIRDLGVRIALDDFGAGFSSFSYLQRFQFDKIKIDRAFCTKVDSDNTNAALVRAVASLGRDLEMKVVAEGVEGSAQSDTLAAQGCDYLQGFHHGRPAPIDHILTSDELSAFNLTKMLRRLRGALGSWRREEKPHAAAGAQPADAGSPEKRRAAG